MVLLFTGAVSMWAYLCFKAKATQRQANTESVMTERNSQVIYESIPEGTNGTVAPPSHIELVQHTSNEQQGQEMVTPPNNIGSESEFVYMNSNVSLHEPNNTRRNHHELGNKSIVWFKVRDTTAI